MWHVLLLPSLRLTESGRLARHPHPAAPEALKLALHCRLWDGGGQVAHIHLRQRHGGKQQNATPSVASSGKYRETKMSTR